MQHYSDLDLDLQPLLVIRLWWRSHNHVPTN